MKILRIIFYLLSFFILCMVSFIIWEGMSNSYYNKYDNYQLAKIDQAAGSWIPDFVPKDAYDIEEHHTLSHQTQSVSFKFKSIGNFQNILKNYEYNEFFNNGAYPYPYSEQDDYLYSSYNLDWLILEKINKSIISKSMLNSLTLGINEDISYFRTPEYETSCLIVNWSRREAYYNSHCLSY